MSEFFALIGQGLSSFFWAFLLTGAVWMFWSTRLVEVEGYWFVTLWVVVIALVVLTPNGWHSIWSHEFVDWHLLGDDVEPPSPSYVSRLKADLIGALIGATAGVAAYVATRGKYVSGRLTDWTDASR